MNLHHFNFILMMGTFRKILDQDNSMMMLETTINWSLDNCKTYPRVKNLPKSLSIIQRLSMLWDPERFSNEAYHATMDTAETTI